MPLVRPSCLPTALAALSAVVACGAAFFFPADAPGPEGLEASGLVPGALGVAAALALLSLEEAPARAGEGFSAEEVLEAEAGA